MSTFHDPWIRSSLLRNKWGKHVITYECKVCIISFHVAHDICHNIWNISKLFSWKLHKLNSLWYNWVEFWWMVHKCSKFWMNQTNQKNVISTLIFYNNFLNNWNFFLRSMHATKIKLNPHVQRTLSCRKMFVIELIKMGKRIFPSTVYGLVRESQIPSHYCPK